MWYVVFLLFAQKPKSKKSLVLCESCQVLFQARTAQEACAKSQTWAQGHTEETGFLLVGIEHVKSLDRARPGDGTEIGGRFFQKMNPWNQHKKLIPELSQIPTVRFESNRDTPLKELASKEQISKIKRILPRK